MFPQPTTYALLRYCDIMYDIDNQKANAISIKLRSHCVYSFHTPIGNVIHLIFQFEFRLVLFIEGLSFRSFSDPAGSSQVKTSENKYEKHTLVHFFRKLH